MTYQEIAGRVLSMLKHADGNDPSNGHLTMNHWEWPTGVALYGIICVGESRREEAYETIVCI